MAINRKEIFRTDTFETQRVKFNEDAQDLFDISTGKTPIDRLLIDQALVPKNIEDSEGNTGKDGQFLKKTRDGKIIWKSLTIENVLWVSKDGDDTNDGLSQETAKASIGAALRTAQRGFNGKLCDGANNILLNKKLLQDEVFGELLTEYKDYARGNRWIDAYNTIIANKDFIAEEGYDRAQLISPFVPPGDGRQGCIDDVKLFIDAVAFNVKYDGNNKVYDFAEVYTITEFGDLIDGERDNSAVVFQQVAYTMMQVMRQDPAIAVAGPEPPNLVGGHGLTPVFDNLIVLDPLGLAGDTYERKNAYAESGRLISLNKEVIAKEAYNSLIAAQPGFSPEGTATNQDCIDDVLDVLDEIVYNLTYGGNDKVVAAAKLYEDPVIDINNRTETDIVFTAAIANAINVINNTAIVLTDQSANGGFDNTTLTQTIDPYTLADAGTADCVVIEGTLNSFLAILQEGIGSDGNPGTVTTVSVAPDPATQYGYGCTDVASAIWNLSLIYLQAIGSDATPGNLDGITRTSNNRFVFPDSPPESGRWKDARNLIYSNMDEIQDRSLAEIALEYPDFFFPDDDQTNRFSRYKDSHRLIQQNRREIIDRALAQIAVEYEEVNPDFGTDWVYPGDPIETPISRYKDAYRSIQKNRLTIVKLAYEDMVIEAGIRGLTLPAGNQEKCERDIGFFVDAVSLDVYVGGNTYTNKFLENYYTIVNELTPRDLLTVDPLQVSGSVIDTEASQSYLGVTASAGGAVFDVTRDADGALDTVVVTTRGTYFVGDTVTIDGTQVGGSTGVDDITITVTEDLLHRNFKLNGLDGEEEASLIAFQNVQDLMDYAVTNQYQNDQTITLQGVRVYAVDIKANEYDPGAAWYVDTTISIGESTYGDGLGDVPYGLTACADVRATINTLYTSVELVLEEERTGTQDNGYTLIPAEDNAPQGQYQDASNLVFGNKNYIADRSLAQVAVRVNDDTVAIDFSFPGDEGDSQEKRFYDGYRLIQGNRNFIINETWANTATAFPAIIDTEDKCRRDISYYIDSLSLDVFLQGNRYTREFTLQYFDKYGVPTTEVSATQKAASQFAFSEAARLMRIAVRNGLSFQDLDILPGNPVYNAGNEVDDVSNTDATACTDVQTTISNLETIVDDVIAADDIDLLPYINNGVFNKNGLNKCKRDIGYLIDGVVEDLYGERNINSKAVALSYFPGGTFVGLDGEGAESIIAFDQAAVEMGRAVTNQLYFKDLTIPADPITQSNTDPNSCAQVRSTIDSLVAITTDAIAAEVGLAGDGILSINAVDDDYGPVPPGETKCGRDVGLFVDSISLDIFLGAGNTYARKNAQTYFLSNDVPIYPGLVGEESISVFAFNKARDMMQKAVTNQLFVKDLTLTPGAATFGEKIVALDRVGGVATVTTSVDHELETGDVVNIVDTGTAFDFAGATVTVISTTQFTYTDGQGLEPDESLTGTDLGTVVRPNFESGNEDACVDVQASIASLSAIVTDVLTAGNLNNLVKETKFREDRFDDAAGLIGLNKNEIQDKALAQIAIEHPDFVFRGDDPSTDNMRFFDAYRLIQGDGVTDNKALIIEDAYAAAAANPLYSAFFATLTAEQITKCKRDTGYFIDAVSLDVFTQGNRYIRYNTEYYFDENGNFIPTVFHPSGATEESLFVFRCAAELMKAAITNQDSFTFREDLATGPIYLTADLTGYYKDLTITPDPVTKSNIDPLSCSNVRTLIDNLTTIKVDEITAGAADPGYELDLPSLNEGIFLDTDSLLTPGGKKCRRDIGLVIDAVMEDLKGRSNTNILEAANSYLEGGVLIAAIEDEVPQTLSAFNKAVEVMQSAVINELYKRDLTITIDPDPNPCQDVQNEIATLVSIVTDTLSAGDDSIVTSTTVRAGSPGSNEVKCRRDIGYVTRAIAEDIFQQSNINMITVARKYFDTDGNPLANGVIGEESQSVYAFNAAAKYAKKALTNQLFGKDTELFTGPEEYGLSFAARDYTKSGSSKVCIDIQKAVDNLIAIIDKVITEGSLAHLDTVKENYGPKGWTKGEALCFRDTGYVIDAVATDLKVGGNVNVTDVGNFYFDNVTGELIYIDGELEQSINAYRVARDLMKKAANQWIVSPSNDIYEPKYSLEPLYFDKEVIIDFDYPYCTDVGLSIDNYWNIIESMLVGPYDGVNGGPFSVPVQLPSFKTTVFVKSGVYTEQTPIVLPPNTGIFGDNLRDVSIYPSDPTQNLIYCENGGYITNVTFSGHLFPSYTCSFPKVKIGDTFTKIGTGSKGSYEITLDDTQGLKERMYVTVKNIPEGSLTGGVATAAVIVSIQDKVITLSTANELDFTNIELNFDYYIGTAGNITRSPYVQNCTSLTTTGSGLIVDGNLATGTASFVLDSYTQYNQGGDGITIVNGGYTQLVSIFEICCNRAVYLTAGSTCSITNSNTDFGNFGLVADGVSPLQYTAFVDGTQQPGAEFKLKGLPRKPYIGQGITIGNNGRPYFFIQEINITNGGSGYTSPPSVDIDDPTGPSGIPAQAIANLTDGVVTSITIVSSGSQFIDPPTITLTGGGFTEQATVEPEMYPQYYSIVTSTVPDAEGKATITTDETIAFDLNDGDEVFFFQQTRIIANSHCMEYVGAGTKIQEAIPARGGVPIQEREVVELNGGKVAFTSTDQLGNFRIGQGLQINQNTGTLSGDSFQRSLFVTVTPFILALS